MSLVLAIVVTLAVIYVVPLVIYGAASALGGMELPSESSPQRFLLGVFVTKLGTAIAFVLLFQLALDAWVDLWFLYAVLWFVMFAASEIGDAISGRSSWPEAVLGVLSEAVYAPASAFAVSSILGGR